MFTLSRQQLFELQLAANREGLLLNQQQQQQMITTTPPTTAEFSTPSCRNRDLFVPHTAGSTAASSSMVTLQLQEKLDALKRQNQDAISKLLARRQSDDFLSSTNAPSHSGRDYSAFVSNATSGLMNEHHPCRNNVSVLASAKKTYPNGTIQGLLATTQLMEQRKQSIEESVTKKQQEVLEAEYADPKPKRPLSAYNLFFQEERQKMLEDRNDDHKVAENADDEMSKPAASTDSVSETTATTTANQSDSEENPKKRKRYEPHRKMSFECMAKTIAKRWKETQADESKLQPYQDIAKIEKARYVKELSQWKLRRRQRIKL